MIFLTVGIEIFQFDRLINALDDYCGSKDIEAFMQTGSSTYEPRYCAWVKFLNYKQTMGFIENASIIIAHAGVGTLLSCISCKKVPFIIPRRREFGEHVDNHQVEFARTMEEKGLAHIIDPLDIDKIIKIHTNNKNLGCSKNGQRRVELIGFLDSIST